MAKKTHLLEVRPFLIALFVVFFTLAGLLIATKRPWQDEAWFTAQAVNLATNGSFGTPLIEPTGSHLNLENDHRVVLTGIRDRTYWILPVYPLFLSGWVKIFGTAFFSVRLFSLAWALVLLASLWMIVERLEGGRTAALVAVAVLALEFGFLISTADGRMDMMCAALGFLAIAVYLGVRQRHLFRATLLAHTLAAVSLFAHPNGMFAVASLLLCTLWLDRKRISTRLIATVAAPYCVSLALWGAYIAKAPSEFVAQFGASSAHRADELFTPWRGIYREIALRYLNQHFLPLTGSAMNQTKIIGLVVFLGGIAVLLASKKLRGHWGCQLLLSLTLLHFLMMSVGASLKYWYYLVYILPLYAAIVGIAATFLWRHGGRLIQLAVATALSLYFVVQIAVSVHTISIASYQKAFVPAMSYLRSILRADDVVDASPEIGFAFGFLDPRFVDDLWIGRWSGRQPTILIVDDWYYRPELVKNLPNTSDHDRYVTETLKREYHVVKVMNGYTFYRRN